jgi:hypothetical protein
MVTKRARWISLALAVVGFLVLAPVSAAYACPPCPKPQPSEKP